MPASLGVGVRTLPRSSVRAAEPTRTSWSWCGGFIVAWTDTNTTESSRIVLAQRSNKSCLFFASVK